MKNSREAAQPLAPEPKVQAMTMMTIPPFVGEPLLMPTTHRARSRLKAFLVATGAMIDTGAAQQNALLAECYVAPFAGFVATATCCGRPLLYPEAQLIAQSIGLDMILLRFDAERGTSFDVLFEGSERWLCCYLAWRRRDGDLWFIPSAGEGPFIRVCAWGLEQIDTPPYDNAPEREAGIMLAIDTPSFEGSL